VTGGLAKLDRWIDTAERWIVSVSLVVMAMVVFLDVVYRRYADPESRFGTIFALASGIERDGPQWGQVHTVFNLLGILGGIVLLFLAARSARRRPLWGDGPDRKPLSLGAAAGLTAAIVIGTWGAMILMFPSSDADIGECLDASWSVECGLFPVGVVWASPLGLVLTLWVGFLGAAMAARARRHLRVEAVEQRLPERTRRLAGLAAGFLTAIFCLFLAYLAQRYVLKRYDDWVASDYLGGLHDGIPIPRWASFSIVPLAYLLIGARYVANAIRGLHGEIDDTPYELQGLTREAGPEAEAPTPSEPVP
jgi:TRAP-type C4-dicarboxylate transport system permease small subunit